MLWVLTLLRLLALLSIAGISSSSCHTQLNEGCQLLKRLTRLWRVACAQTIPFSLEQFSSAASWMSHQLCRDWLLSWTKSGVLRSITYFFQFVNALVEREAREKWIDQSGEPHQPLLTVEEHHELLGMVAQEMWLSTTDSLRPDVLSVIAEVFAESRSKPPVVARQIRERLKQHSLLVSTGTAANALAFDHEDFKAFYLGEAVGRALDSRLQGELRSMLKAGLLSRSASDEAISHIRRLGGDVAASLSALQTVARSETSASLVRENCGSLAIGLVEDGSPIELTNMSFPEDALRARSLVDLTVRDSYFQASSLAGAHLNDCVFQNCRFERLELDADTHIIAVLQECEVGMLMRVDRDEQIFDPVQIYAALAQAGFDVRGRDQESLSLGQAESDEELWLVERVMRIFLRANQVNEDVIPKEAGREGLAIL